MIQLYFVPIVSLHLQGPLFELLAEFSSASLTEHQPLLLKIAVYNRIFGEHFIYKWISQFSTF